MAFPRTNDLLASSGYSERRVRSAAKRRGGPLERNYRLTTGCYRRQQQERTRGIDCLTGSLSRSETPEFYPRNVAVTRETRFRPAPPRLVRLLAADSRLSAFTQAPSRRSRTKNRHDKRNNSVGKFPVLLFPLTLQSLYDMPDKTRD